MIIAGNRPKYLFSLLSSVMNATGATPASTHVYINGYHEEPAAVAALFGLAHSHLGQMGVANGVIGNHYRLSLVDVFQRNPGAKFAIILEEDLIVSPDIFRRAKLRSVPVCSL